MRKALFCVFALVLLAPVFSSCTVVVKDRPVVLHREGFIVVKSWDGEADVKAIRVWGVPELTGERAVREIEPGTEVKVLKVTKRAALVEFPDGDTGWIKKAHVVY
jgi:hypothetical protein